MRTRVVFLFSILAAAILGLASCAPSATITNNTSTAPPKTTSASTTTVAPLATSAVEVPKYGGVLTIATGSSVFQFDEGMGVMCITSSGFTHNEPAIGDWAKGPAGTGEADWTYTGNDRLRLKTGAVVESWDIPETGHIIFHVRQGVRFGLNPNNEASRLVNGREMTADDVAYSLQRLCTEPRAYVKVSYPKLAATTVFTVVDKYTVDIKIPPSEFADGMSQWFDRNNIIAREVVQKYGNVNKWELQVGTGPFYVTDYVEGSSMTFAGNSKYWMKDPVGPGKGNQLPYLDGVKLLVITDASTSQAAMRTAKISQMNLLNIDDFDAVKKSVPAVNSKRWLTHATTTIAMHLYDPALPTSNLKVRRALFMATDLKGIKDELYRGDAEVQSWPHPYLKEYASMFLPLTEAPASVQELYKYNPEKAKALLAEAGYPNGFRSRIVCNNVAGDVDFLSAVKSMWAKVGVDLEIQPKESAVYTNMWQTKSYEDMLFAGGMGIGGYYRCIAFDTPSYWNPGQVNDPYVQEVKVKIYDLFNQQKIDELDATFKDLMRYALDQAWYIPRPLAYQYCVWWPWLKNYHGELALGWAGPNWNWTQFVWVDQELRDQMGGR